MLIKRLFITLLLIFCCPNLYAIDKADILLARTEVPKNYYAGIVVGNYYSTVTYDACSSCQSDSDEADTLCEDFDETGTLCTYTQSIVGTNTFDDDNSHTGTYNCTDKGTYDAEFVWDTAQGNCYIYDSFSAISNAYLMFDFYLTSINLDDTESVVLAELAYDGTDECVRLRVRNSSGTNYINIGYYGTGGIEYASGSTALSTGVWYTVTVEWQSGSKVEVTLDTVGDGSPSTEITDSSDIGTRTVQRCYIGTIDSRSTGNSATFEIDRVKLDDDTMPSQCGT